MPYAKNPVLYGYSGQSFLLDGKQRHTISLFAGVGYWTAPWQRSIVIATIPIGAARHSVSSTWVDRQHGLIGHNHAVAVTLRNRALLVAWYTTTGGAGVDKWQAVHRLDHANHRLNFLGLVAAAFVHIHRTRMSRVVGLS
jgi:hypothetical protein